MNCKQKVVFDFNDARLTISADSDEFFHGTDGKETKTENASSKMHDTFSQENDVNFQNIGMSESLDDATPIQYIPSNELINLFFLEETDYKLIFEIKSSKITLDDVKLFNELSSHRPEIFNRNEINEKIVSYDLNFRSHVGEQFLDISYGDFEFLLPIEIRSRKIHYETDYPEMISDLAKYTSSILFDKNSSLFHGYEQYDRKETKYEDYMLLEYLFKSENLPSVQEYLSKNLYSKLSTFSEEVPLDFAYNINDDVLSSLASNPVNIVESSEEMYLFKYNDKFFIPTFIDEIKHEEDIDIPENRFYKYFLEYVKYLISDLKNDNEITGYIEERLEIFENRINQYLSRDYFSGISKLNYVPLNSQVLQKKEGYRDIFEYFLILEFGYKINCDLITNEIKGYEKRLSQIYEYWCFFKLYELIDDLTGSEKDEFDNFIDDNLALNVKRGFVNNFKFITENHKEICISLAFKKVFPNSPTKIYRSYSLEMDPDYTVSINYSGKTYLIHFDAKYKVKKGRPKSEDIQKMHTYKDAIVNSIASFVLFPGDNNYNNQYIDFSNKINSVGAFSLNPKDNEQEIDNIKNYLLCIIDAITADDK